MRRVAVGIHWLAFFFETIIIIIGVLYLISAQRAGEEDSVLVNYHANVALTCASIVFTVISMGFHIIGFAKLWKMASKTLSTIQPSVHASVARVLLRQALFFAVPISYVLHFAGVSRAHFAYAI